MASQPSVSVCIPTHNRARDLAARLEELRRQTLTAFEIVIVDDASTDETEAVVLCVARSDPRVRYVPVRPGLGHPGVTLRCFAEARTDLVAIFHDHDAYRADAVERLVHALAAAPEAPFAFCAVRTLDPITRQVRDVSVNPAAPSLRRDVVDHFVRTGHSLVGASAVMVRRAHLPADAPSSDLGLFADVEMWCRMAAAGMVAYVDEPLVDVVGWAPLEGLVKLNWTALGHLERLRRTFVAAVADSRMARVWLHVAVVSSTTSARLRWLVGLIRHVRRTGDDPAPALSGVPRPIASALRLASSVGARTPAR